jgi:hypothetical protein
VLIGSTAPSLFDIKPTSMAREFPGAEILATAIDNVRHNDHIRVPQSRIPVLIAAILILWGTAWGFYRNVEPERFRLVFGLSQIGLLGISYLTINLSNFFFNLTGPVMLGFIYFSIAKVYALATSRALERNVVVQSLHDTGGTIGTIAVFHIAGADEFSTGMVLRSLKKAVAALSEYETDVEIVRGKQRGIFGLLGGTLAVSWMHHAGDSAAQATIQQDVDSLLAAMPRLVQEFNINGEKVESQVVVSAPLSPAGATPTLAQWRRLLGKALVQEEPKG